MLSPSPVEVVRIGVGTPAIVLISPLLADSRVWGQFAEDVAVHASVSVTEWPGHHDPDAALPEVMNPVEALDAAVHDLPEVADVVVAVGQDAAAAVHMAAAGRARGIVLIGPQFVNWPADFVVEDDEIQSMPEGHMEAMVDAATNQDATAMAHAMVAMESDLPAEDRTRLVGMFEDNLRVVFAGPDWPQYPKDWQLQIPELQVPLVLLTPHPETPAGRLPARRAETFASLAGDAQVYSLSNSSEFPWLIVPEEVLTPIRDLLARLVP